MHMICHVRYAMLAACLLSGAAHADPVPQSKLVYVGSWEGKDMQLTLSKEGKVKYKLDRPGKQVDLNVNLQGFEGNNFRAGWAFMSSTFVVSKPPHRVGNQWKMTVDGVELTKAD